MLTNWHVYFRQLLSTIIGRFSERDGYPLFAIEAVESRLGVTLPRCLQDYYLTIGRHRINRIHNRLLAPEDLRIAQGRLVFMEENQWVVLWGLRSKTNATDPVAFQTMDPDEGEWAAEGRCSQFLPGMLCWQAVSGGLPHIGYSDRIETGIATQLAKE